MVAVLRLASEASLRCRFAVSPVHETTDALRSLIDPRGAGYHLPWQRQVRPVLPRLELEPLFALLPPGGYQPDFISPPPTGPTTDIGSELERIGATPPHRVAAEISRCLRGRSPSPEAQRWRADVAADPAVARDRVVSLLDRAWRALIGPWWPALRDVLDADVTFRARQLADAGVAATLGDLHPRIRWRDGALRVGVRGHQERTVSDDGIVLVPSVFAWPGLGVMLDPPWQPTVIYPARGISDIWQPARRAAGEVSRLIGRTRAVVLTALAQPASTTGLAARCGLPVSTVSEHLAVLRAGGLVSTVRVGRSLLHQRTALGVALVGRGDR